MTRTLMHPMAADTARNNRHFQLIVDVHLLLLSDGDLLLGRRANTGYGDGAYEPPSDRLAERETLVEAAVRVAGAQVGIELDAGRVSLAHVMHDVSGHGRMAFFLTADGWERPSDIDAAARRPGAGSYSDFGWYPLTELPANMIDRARVAVRNYAAGARFSTYPAFGMLRKPRSKSTAPYVERTVASLSAPALLPPTQPTGPRSCHLRQRHH
jgi:8-oxo-dGTP diphosphatase